MENKIDICYLCGKKLKGNIDDDHVPPKQFYAKSIRNAYFGNIRTLFSVTSGQHSGIIRTV